MFWGWNKLLLQVDPTHTSKWSYRAHFMVFLGLQCYILLQMKLPEDEIHAIVNYLIMNIPVYEHFEYISYRDNLPKQNPSK